MDFDISPKKRLSRGTAPKSLSNSQKAKKGVKNECARAAAETTRQAQSIRIEAVQVNNFPRAFLGRNYLVPRNHLNTITFEATTAPNDSAEEWNQIIWHVNDVVVQAENGSNGKRIIVAGNVTNRFKITATLDGESDEVNLWVFWATVDILTAGNIPAGCNLSFDFNGSLVRTEPPALGPKCLPDLSLGVGRICARATFQPAGLHNLLLAGLRFCRRIDQEFDCADGVLFGGQARPDNSANQNCKQFTLNDQERIYDLDAPSIFADHRSEFFNELRINFTQWVTYYGVVCSDQAQWHFIGEFLAYPPLLLEANPYPPQPMMTPNNALNPSVVRLVVGGGHIPIPLQSRYTKTGNNGNEIIHNSGEL